MKDDSKCLICGKEIEIFGRDRRNYKKRTNYPFGRKSKARRSYIHWNCLYKKTDKVIKGVLSSQMTSH